MSNQDDPNSKKSKGDLTSLFDLSDFEHTEDPETEAYFQEKQDAEDAEDEENNENEIDDISSDEDDIFNGDDEEEIEPFSTELTQTEFNPQALFDSEEDDENIDNEENDFDDDFGDFQTETENEIENETEEDEFEELEIQELPESRTLEAAEVTTAITATSETATHYEKFDDIQKFAKNSHYGPVSAKGEPPFSMIIENIKYKEDASKIFATLKEFGFINQDNEHIISKGLERGSAIISRVSEFAIIFLYTKLSQLPIKLRVGPSDLIFSSSSNEHTHQGSVSTDHLLQNREDSKRLNNNESTSIMFSSQSEIQGYIVEEFLGHCFETLEFQAYPEAGELDQSLDQLQAREIFTEIKEQTISALKDQLQKMNANAGIDFEVSTRALFTEDKQDYTYQMTAKCNAVWIKKSI